MKYSIECLVNEYVGVNPTNFTLKPLVFTKTGQKENFETEGMLSPYLSSVNALVLSGKLRILKEGKPLDSTHKVEVVQTFATADKQVTTKEGTKVVQPKTIPMDEKTEKLLADKKAEEEAAKAKADAVLAASIIDVRPVDEAPVDKPKKGK